MRDDLYLVLFITAPQAAMDAAVLYENQDGGGGSQFNAQVGETAAVCCRKSLPCVGCT